MTAGVVQFAFLRQSFRVERAFRACVRTAIVPTGLGPISHLPSTPPAAPCWAKLFRPCGAGFLASEFHRQIPSLVLTPSSGPRQGLSRILGPRRGGTAIYECVVPTALGFLRAASTRARTSIIHLFRQQKQHALKGHGFQLCRYAYVESWASTPEGTRTSSQHRSPSVAKAIVMTAAYGTA